MKDDGRLTYSIKEVAFLMGVGVTTVYDAVRRGDLPSLRLGNRILIPKHKLQELMDEAGNEKEKTDV